MAMVITICRYCMVVVLLVLPGLCAPRSKSSYRNAPQTVYDQKQTGDYNIQLHLKDFQIIALLGDDSFGSYDYDYDYADLTIKPSTPKPSTEPPLTPKPQPSTSPPPSTPKPTVLVPDSSSPPPTLEQKPSPNSKPEPQEINSTEVVITSPQTPKNVTRMVEVSTHGSVKPEETNSPGKIKVQIIETPVGVVPGEIQGQQDGAVNHGEMLQIRRCALGFARDKKGRCRRVRRPGGTSPQLQYGISRLANNLASRLRYGSSEESLSESESTED